MTTKTLTGIYTSGYTLAASYSALDVTASASVGGANGGGIGISIGSVATLLNDGTIAGGVSGYSAHSGSATRGVGGVGVVLASGGSVTNRTGTITGGAAGSYYYQVGGVGVVLVSGGSVTNGTGTIMGGTGGYDDVGGVGVVLVSGGSLTNGTGTIAGGAGGNGGFHEYDRGGGAGAAGSVIVSGGSVINVSGTIVGGAGGNGIEGFFPYRERTVPSGAGGAGGAGIDTTGYATMPTTGSIAAGGGGAGGSGFYYNDYYTGNKYFYAAGAAGVGGDGVMLAAGGTITNGSSKVKTARVSGLVGIYSGSAATATVTNFGTIEGTGGTAVLFGLASDRLIAMVGSELIGLAQGGGGTLELASGTGTISGLGAGASVSGAVTMAFGGFGTYQLDGGTWTLTGNSTLAPGQVLNAHGPTSAASTTVTGVLSNAGLLEATTAAGLILSQTTVANVGGTITATSGSKVMLEGVTIMGGVISSTGSGKVFTANNTFNVLDGSVSTLTLPALTSLTVADTTYVILKGNINNSGKISLSAITHSAQLTIGGTGVTLSGGGAVTLSANAGNLIAGASGLVLTNVDNKITGGGAIGGGALTIVNQANGLIEQTGTVALNLSSGAHTIVNAGVIEAAGTGGMTIKSAIANTGLIEAVKGNLTATGAVTGTGSAVVNAATLYFASTFNENVKFSGTTGVLELAKSTTYTGTITGFSKLGTTQLDLLDIGLIAGTTKATFAGTITGGILTVTDGTHTASIKLTGNYTTSTFVVATDNHGGTLIHDPTTPVSPSPAAMASAMAGMGGASGAPAHWTAPEPTRFLALAAPVSLR